MGPGRARREQRAGFDRVELLTRTSSAAARAGLPDRAIGLLDAALAEVDPAPKPERVAHLLVKRAMQCEGVGIDPMADLDRALALAGPGSRDRAAALAARAAVLMVEGQMPAGPADGRAGPSWPPRSAGTSSSSATPTTRSDASCSSSAAARRASTTSTSRTASRSTAGSGPELFRYYGNYSDVLIGAGRFREASEMAREGRRAAAEQGLSRTQGAFLAGNEAEAEVLAGHWDDALATIDEALRLEPPPVTPRPPAHAPGDASSSAAATSSAAADAADRAAEHLTAARRQPQHMLPLAVVRAELAVADGDHDDGAADDAASARPRPQAPLVPTSAGWPFAWAWARLLLDAGRRRSRRSCGPWSRT